MTSLIMIKINFNKLKTKTKGYVRENWGSPFIGGFILLLLTAAVLLSVGSSYWAEEIAVYAYYLLVAGVFLQLVCYIKYKRNDAEEDL
jgi:hypothetical protein